MDDPKRPWAWRPGRIAVGDDGQSATLWHGATPVLDVWEIAEGFIWAGGDAPKRTFVQHSEGSFDDAKKEAFEWAEGQLYHGTTTRSAPPLVG